MVHWHVDPEEVNDDDRQDPNEVQKSPRTVSVDDVLPKLSPRQQEPTGSSHAGETAQRLLAYLACSCPLQLVQV